jgi:DNA-directed RNA polymerase specialized sigma24 family protein
MAARSDPPSVARHDEERLRRFVACRDAGDGEGARRWWEELVEANFDRVVGMVAIQGRGGRLSRHEQEEAVQRAVLKIWQHMVSTFEGASVGEWVNAVKTCVGFACMDVQREAARRTRREPSLDETVDDVPRYEWRVAELAQSEHRRDGEREDARGFVAWGLPQMKNDRQRLVIERSLDGVPAEAIAAELAVSLPNLYQLRSRGLRDLALLKELYDA